MDFSRNQSKDQNDGQIDVTHNGESKIPCEVILKIDKTSMKEYRLKTLLLQCIMYVFRITFRIPTFPGTNVTNFKANLSGTGRLIN